MGILFNRIALKMIVKSMFKAITGAGTQDESLYEEGL